MKFSVFSNECIDPRQYESYSIHWEPSATSDSNEGVIQPLVTCYFVILPHLMDVLSMTLSFAGHLNFVNKLRLDTFHIQFMYDNLNFLFLLRNKSHLYFVTFLLSVSIISKRLFLETLRYLTLQINRKTNIWSLRRIYERFNGNKIWFIKFT